MTSISVPAPWRRARPSGFPVQALAPWATMLWVALALNEVNPHLGPMSILTAIPAGWGLWIIAMIAYRLAVRSCRRWLPPPKEVAAPPAQEQAYENFLRSPSPVYPTLAQARGQCGWVSLRLRVDPQGRVTHYQIADQAPGRTFERAVTRTLRFARLKAIEAREARTNVVFVTPSPAAPEWAITRYAQATGDQPTAAPP